MARACPTCGQEVHRDDVECSLCGEELSPPLTTQRAASAGPGAGPPRGPGFQPEPEQFSDDQDYYDDDEELPRDAVPDRYPFDESRTRSRRPTVGPLAAVATLVALVAVGAWLVAGRGGSEAAPAASAPGAYPQISETTIDAPPSTEPEIATEDPTEPPDEDPEQAALVALQERRDQDVQRVDLDDRWVAQLSSKVPGTTDQYQTASNGTNTFQATDILAQLEEFDARSDLGTVFLLASTDYGKHQTYGGRALWVVFADDGFSSAASVHRWCTKTFGGYSGDELENACTARRLRA